MFERVAQRPFTAGDFVARTFGVWWRNLGRFSLLTVIAYLPLFLAAVGIGAFGAYQAAQAGGTPDPDAVFGALLPMMIPVFFLAVALGAVQMAALTYGALQDLAGRKVRMGELLGVGFRRALPAAAVMILCGLAILLGYVLLVVPGIMAACALSVAVPVAVVERTGMVAALRRSLELTAGLRWALFAAFFVLMIALMLIHAVNSFALPLVWQQFGPVGVIVGSLLTICVSLAIASLPTVAPAVAYHDLRVAKEGVGGDDLAKVFE